MMKYSKERIQEMVSYRIRSAERPLTLDELSKATKVQRVILQPVVRAMVEDGTLQMAKPGGDLAPTFSQNEASLIDKVNPNDAQSGLSSELNAIVLDQPAHPEVTTIKASQTNPESVTLELAPNHLNRALAPTNLAPNQSDTDDCAGVERIAVTETARPHPVFRTWLSRTRAIRSYPLIEIEDINNIITGTYRGDNYLPTLVPVGEVGFWIAVNQNLMSSGWFPYFMPGALLLIDASKRHVQKDGVHLVFYSPQSAYAIKRLDEFQSLHSSEPGMTVIGMVMDVRLQDSI